MARPSKPISVVKEEKKGHRTKAEIEAREKNEAALSTGEALKERNEVKSDKIAHKEFKRIQTLLRKINKNDALLEAVINRYCLLYSDYITAETDWKSTLGDIESLRDRWTKEQNHEEPQTISAETYFEQLLKLQQASEKSYRKLKDIRSELFAIEKENCMTVASQLRSIPKGPDKVTEEDDPTAVYFVEFGPKGGVKNAL